MRHDTVLVGEHVTLRPLALTDAPALAGIVDDESWRWMTVAQPGPESEKAVAFIAGTFSHPEQLSFAVIVDGEVQGMSSFHDHQPQQLATFVGWTLYARGRRGDGRTNPESKLLLLSHAFEDLGCERVGLRADGLNAHSLAAITKLGAVREGTMRSHLIRPSGGRRDTVFFSVLRDEWTGVRAGLESRLGR
jgi:RimJ/RimL family protein N-acetyltransferase